MAAVVVVLAVVAVLAVVLVVLVTVGRYDEMPAEAPDLPDSGLPGDRPLQAADLQRVRFPIAWRGYRMVDVDDCLLRAEDAMAALEARNAELETSNAELEARNAELEEWTAEPEDRPL